MPLIRITWSLLIPITFTIPLKKHSNKKLRNSRLFCIENFNFSVLNTKLEWSLNFSFKIIKYSKTYIFRIMYMLAIRCLLKPQRTNGEGRNQFYLKVQVTNYFFALILVFLVRKKYPPIQTKFFDTILRTSLLWYQMGYREIL